MRKIVLVPDSFKGTMSSARVCEIMRESILSVFPQCDVISIPVADGGEGSVDAFLSALGGERVSRVVCGPLKEPVPAFFGMLSGGRTAVIEMAACAGLPYVAGRHDPLGATTYGVAQAMLECVRLGAGEIILGLGGSATTDGGCGAAAAAGVKFFDINGEPFVPTGGTLINIARIDASGMDERIKNAKTTAMCDIANPLYGENGAAYVFGPQKGADDAQVGLLDAGLRNLGMVMLRDLSADVANIRGAGAAGGMGAGAAAFFGAQLKPGIETVLDTAGFDERARGADLVITGEGKIDTSSMYGKVVSGVAVRASALGVPVAAIVGDIGEGAEKAYEHGVSAIFSINRVAVPDMRAARARSENDMRAAVENLMRIFRAVTR